MTPTDELAIKNEFRKFRLPHKFRGGCLKSANVPGYCVHVTHEGRIGMIEEGCTSRDQCLGHNFKFNP